MATVARGRALLRRCIWSPEMYLFIGLYMVYGVVIGLSNSVRLLVCDGDGTPPVLESTLSVLEWSPIIAIFVAPIVEAVHVPYVGRRKVSSSFTPDGRSFSRPIDRLSPELW